MGSRGQNQKPPQLSSKNHFIFLMTVQIQPSLFHFLNFLVRLQNYQLFGLKTGPSFLIPTSHYVASQTLSRIMQFIFWVFSFKELDETVNSTSFLPSFVGFFVLIAQIIQIALTGDFLYFYITSIKQGIPLTLPSYVI
ncbi:hypothetical protein ABPG72_021650 [Tetrahymena utriculariae]